MKQFDIVIKTENELKILEKAFNRMIEKLLQARMDLEGLNRSLEEKVKQRTQKLQDYLSVMEGQNTSLIASYRKLEDDNTNKVRLLTRLNDLYENHIKELQTSLDQVLAFIGKGHKGLILKAYREAHYIEEVIRPISSLYSTEKAIQKKKVLLAESNKRQQIVAKMALRGTGLELDIASDLEEGLGLLGESKYDVIFVGTDFIELSAKAKEQYADIESVFMTSENLESYLPILVENPFLSNIVSRNERDRTFTLKNIITTVSKLISKDLFGLEKYLSWGVEVTEHPIIDSDQREDLVDTMQSDLKQLGFRRNVLSSAAMMTEELLMNAIYDAPTDAEGKSLYNHLPRTERIELTPEQQGKLRYATDGHLLAISVEDPFGALSRQIILDYLQSCYEGRGGSLNEEKGGGGRGLFQIMETADLVVINVKPRIKTEVVVIINIDPDHLKEDKTTSLHYFYA